MENNNPIKHIQDQMEDDDSDFLRHQWNSLAKQHGIVILDKVPAGLYVSGIDPHKVGEDYDVDALGSISVYNKTMNEENLVHCIVQAYAESMGVVPARDHYIYEIAKAAAKYYHGIYNL